MKTGMRKGQAWLPHDMSSIEQEIEVQGPRPVTTFKVPTQCSFDLMAHGQQTLDSEIRLKAQNTVQEPLGAWVSDICHWLRLVQR